MNLKNYSGDACTLDDVRSALVYVDCEVRDIWVQMGMAIKAEFGEAGFDEWDSWSQGYSRYKASEVRTTWKSFKGGQIGIGTLFKSAIDAGWRYKPDTKSQEDLQKLRKAQDERRQQRVIDIQEEEKIAEQLRLAVADAAETIWDGLEKEGGSEYLTNKKVKAFGIRFFKYGVVVITHEETAKVEVITGKDNLNHFFKNRPEDTHFHYHRSGCIAVPMRDVLGKLWGLQIIYPSGKKKFMKGARKQGTYHSIGDISVDAPLCVVEGYATGSSVYQATGWPVAVVWDSGNLVGVSVELMKKLPSKKLLICGDDDVATKDNPGRTFATKAASAVGGHVAFPDFSAIAPKRLEESGVNA